MGLFGYPDDIQQDFSFDPSYASYRPSSGLMRGIGDLQDTAGKQKRLGGEFSQAYRQMLDPGSAYYQRMFGELRKGVGDTAAQTRVGMNQALASRGVGQGGMSSLLGSATMNTAGEQMRQGFTGIQSTGLGHAGTFGGLANTAYGTAGQIYGQAGGLLSGIDDRTLGVSMQNAQTENAYNQYLRQSQYNQSVQNQNAQSAYWNSVMGFAGDVGAAALTGGASLAAGGLFSAMMGGGQTMYNDNPEHGA